MKASSSSIRRIGCVRRRLRWTRPGRARYGQGRNGGIWVRSDYYHHGGFGTVRVTQPMVLGHEVAGRWWRRRRGRRVKPVTVWRSTEPALQRLCYCWRRAAALPSTCVFTAARCAPHVQGGFREVSRLRREPGRPADMPLERAAFAEPLAVCLHAVRQAASCSAVASGGRRWPHRGALCPGARHAGAREIVAPT